MHRFQAILSVIIKGFNTVFIDWVRTRLLHEHICICQSTFAFNVTCDKTLCRGLHTARDSRSPFFAGWRKLSWSMQLVFGLGGEF